MNMKKVASIVAVVVFAVGMLATQAESTLDFDFDIENMLACGDCEHNEERGNDNKKNA